jgi:hypothetical protein
VQETFYKTGMCMKRACRNFGRQVAVTTQCSLMAPNICESSVCRLLHVSLLEPRSLWWLPDFLRNCSPLTRSNIFCKFRRNAPTRILKAFLYACSVGCTRKYSLWLVTLKNLKQTLCVWQRPMSARSIFFLVTCCNCLCVGRPFAVWRCYL